jgi:hypothetical protein
MSAEASFHDRYPAPWRIDGDDVLDAGDCSVMTFGQDDLAFWQGIVEAVNSSARLESALRLARAL